MGAAAQGLAAIHAAGRPRAGGAGGGARARRLRAGAAPAPAAALLLLEALALARRTDCRFREVQFVISHAVMSLADHDMPEGVPPVVVPEAELADSEPGTGARELLPDGDDGEGGRTRGARRARSAETQLVLISDPGQDLDDEMGFIMCKHLISGEDVELLGVVTTLSPSFERARLCRGTLDMLGMHAVPVGVGSDGGDTTAQHSAQGFKDLANSYLPPRESEQSASLQPGQRLLYTLWKGAAPKSLTLAIIASLKDAAIFLRDNEKLFVEKTKEVVIMGGVEAPEAGATLVPDSAHNNQFDRAASEFFYAKCQELGVRLVVVSRWAAYAVPVRANTTNRRLLFASVCPRS
jgi:hypothetical protein